MWSVVFMCVCVYVCMCAPGAACVTGTPTKRSQYSSSLSWPNSHLIYVGVRRDRDSGRKKQRKREREDWMIYSRRGMEDAGDKERGKPHVTVSADCEDLTLATKKITL